MPIVGIELIEGVFDDTRKQRMIHGVTWVRVKKITSGEWAIGGKPMAAEAVRKAQSEPA